MPLISFTDEAEAQGEEEDYLITGEVRWNLRIINARIIKVEPGGVLIIENCTIIMNNTAQGSQIENNGMLYMNDSGINPLEAVSEIRYNFRSKGACELNRNNFFRPNSLEFFSYNTTVVDCTIAEAKTNGIRFNGNSDSNVTAPPTFRNNMISDSGYNGFYIVNAIVDLHEIQISWALYDAFYVSGSKVTLFGCEVEDIYRSHVAIGEDSTLDIKGETNIDKNEITFLDKTSVVRIHPDNGETITLKPEGPAQEESGLSGSTLIIVILGVILLASAVGIYQFNRWNAAKNMRPKLGIKSVELGDTKEKEPALPEIVEEKKSGVKEEFGDMAMESGAYDDALKYYERARALEGHNDAIIVKKAKALEKLERYKESYMAFREAKELNPENSEASEGMMRLEIVAESASIKKEGADDEPGSTTVKKGTGTLDTMDDDLFGDDITEEDTPGKDEPADDLFGPDVDEDDIFQLAEEKDELFDLEAPDEKHPETDVPDDHVAEKETSGDDLFDIDTEDDILGAEATPESSQKRAVPGDDILEMRRPKRESSVKYAPVKKDTRWKTRDRTPRDLSDTGDGGKGPSRDLIRGVGSFKDYLKAKAERAATRPEVKRERVSAGPANVTGLDLIHRLARPGSSGGGGNPGRRISSESPIKATIHIDPTVMNKAAPPNNPGIMNNAVASGSPGITNRATAPGNPTSSSASQRSPEEGTRREIRAEPGPPLQSPHKETAPSGSLERPVVDRRKEEMPSTSRDKTEPERSEEMKPPTSTSEPEREQGREGTIEELLEGREERKIAEPPKEGSIDSELMDWMSWKRSKGD